MNFEYKGVSVTATSEQIGISYREDDEKSPLRHERNVSVAVNFWKFTSWNKNLFELAYIKSTLNFFLQSYWKRSGKDGNRIELEQKLNQTDYYDNSYSLIFSAKQKNSKNYLYICLMENGSMIEEDYFDIHEVTMIDIAIGKAISLLQPQSKDITRSYSNLWC